MNTHCPTDAEVAAGRLQALQSRDEVIARLRAELVDARNYAKAVESQLNSALRPPYPQPLI